MTGKIFLSYRREDAAAGFALALFGRLEQSFSAENLFMDVEGGIKAGQDFVRVIEEQVSACDAMLVLIGPDWLAAADEKGRPRLENPEDFVRIEVESALRLGKRVIPVLVQRTKMPRAEALPEPLKALARRNAVGLTHERFRADAQGLIQALEGVLADASAGRSPATTESAAAAEKRAAELAAKAEEVARAEKERTRLDAIAGLSPEQIAKAEELANWDFVKTRESVDDFRDHLARFPEGLTKRAAWKRLEALVWAELPRPANVEALRHFLEEFPNGANASEANVKMAGLELAERKKLETDAWVSASAAGTVTALEDFRKGWPQSKYADAVRTRIETGLIRTFTGHTNRVSSVAFSPDGRTALSGSLDHTLKFWDVATGREISSFAGHTDRVRSVAFSPDGRTALSGSWDHTLKLWDVVTGKDIRSFAGHSDLVRSVVFSPDGRSALSGSDDKTLKLWDVATGQEIRSFAGHAGWVNSVAFSPDGRSALSGNFDGTLKLWDVPTGKEIRTFAGYPVRSVAFSPEGRSALSGGFDGTVKLLDVATGQEIRSFTGHAGPAVSVAFSPGGRSALSGSEDKTLRLWDVARGKEIRTFTGHTNAVTSVAFSPDGRSALSGSQDKTLKLWDLTADH
jgi:dipeptidyl aminopeptidase/acylaminoacyl peptidase